jgi:hypothetical protein
MPNQYPTETLDALPYQQQIVEYLRKHESQLWEWFATHPHQQDQADAVRLDLLKTTYRIEREEKPDLYQLAEEVAAKLKLDVPLTFYQAQQASEMNASLAYLPGEAHVVLAGPLLDRLSTGELRALVGHELSHLALWERFDRVYLIADQILSAMTYDAQVHPAHLETARLFRLYTEIFCDRGGWFVTGKAEEAISTLVKVETGLADVSASSYVRQAEEIFSKENPQTDGVTHPECYIRARAIHLWESDPSTADPQIARMIEGHAVLERLDLLRQVQVSQTTTQLIAELLRPKWFQTDAVLAHARLYDESFSPVERASEVDLISDIQASDNNLSDYYCYVLMDFVTSDRQLEELPLAAALTLAEKLGLKTRFGEIAIKELRLRKKQFSKIDEAKEKLLAVAEAGGNS